MDLLTITRVTGTAFSILSSLFVVVIFCIVKFNDLAHIDKKLDKLDIKYDEQTKEISSLSAQVSNIDGYIKGLQDKNSK